MDTFCLIISRNLVLTFVAFCYVVELNIFVT